MLLGTEVMPQSRGKSDFCSPASQGALALSSRIYLPEQNVTSHSRKLRSRNANGATEQLASNFPPVFVFALAGRRRPARRCWSLMIETVSRAALFCSNKSLAARALPLARVTLELFFGVHLPDSLAQARARDRVRERFPSLCAPKADEVS